LCKQNVDFLMLNVVVRTANIKTYEDRSLSSNKMEGGPEKRSG